MQLVGETPVSWVPITLNLTVHCVMYWYYFQSARGIKVWWKEYITVMQIVQFVIDLGKRGLFGGLKEAPANAHTTKGFVYFTSYNLVASRHFASLPHVGTCQGSETAALTGVSILTSYLFLFIAFYFATYKRGSAGRTAAQKASDLRKFGEKTTEVFSGVVKVMPVVKE